MAKLKNLRIERIYGSVPRTGEKRILVDRLWPRGTSKAKARLDEWDKQIAPSNNLRKWYGHEPAKWGGFQTKYRAELEANPDSGQFLDSMKKWLVQGPVVLLFGAKNTTQNNAVVLCHWLEGKLS